MGALRLTRTRLLLRRFVDDWTASEKDPRNLGGKIDVDLLAQVCDAFEKEDAGEADADELHLALDLLLARYLVANPRALPSRTTAMALLQWSHSQMNADAFVKHLQARGECEPDEKPEADGSIAESISRLGWTGKGKP
jgi:hypothetical protein